VKEELLAALTAPQRRVPTALLYDELGSMLFEAITLLPEEYRQATDGVEIAPVTCSYGESAYRRTSVITEDIGTAPLWADFRELALRHGIRTCWSYPILSPSRRLLGTFAVHRARQRPPSTAESILKARRDANGNTTDWWSLRPAEYAWLKGLDAFEQIAGQGVGPAVMQRGIVDHLGDNDQKARVVDRNNRHGGDLLKVRSVS